jgi:hypothetical protein
MMDVHPGPQTEAKDAAVQAPSIREVRLLSVLSWLREMHQTQEMG